MDCFFAAILSQGQVFASMLGHFNALPWVQPVEVEAWLRLEDGAGISMDYDGRYIGILYIKLHNDIIVDFKKKVRMANFSGVFSQNRFGNSFWIPIAIPASLLPFAFPLLCFLDVLLLCFSRPLCFFSSVLFLCLSACPVFAENHH